MNAYDYINAYIRICDKFHKRDSKTDEKLAIDFINLIKENKEVLQNGK